MTINQQSLSTLPLATKMLFSGALLVLGVGYLMAMLYVFHSHADRDGDPSLSVDDLIIAYSGNNADSRLESALKGPMASMLPDTERSALIAWVRKGALEAEFTSDIQPITDQRCAGCHASNNPPMGLYLKNYADYAALIDVDTGMDIHTLIRVSHIHLFGITFIFFMMGFVFAQAHFRPEWLKLVVIATPFVAILLDIGSWYLTKLHPGFAWVVMISGALMGICFAIEWLVSMWQMWFNKKPSK